MKLTEAQRKHERSLLKSRAVFAGIWVAMALGFGVWDFIKALTYLPDDGWNKAFLVFWVIVLVYNIRRMLVAIFDIQELDKKPIEQ